MARRVRVRHLAVLLLLLLLLLLQEGWTAAAAKGRVRKKSTRTTRSCQDPPEEMLEQMFGRLSVGVMSAFHHALQLEPHDKLNLSCPTAAADGKARLPVNLRSISPWAYRMLYDPTRFPRHIPEAYCLCSGCLLGVHRGEESELYRSAPVYAPAVVLRRTGSCVGGRHSYTEIYVSVAVGCTCVPRPWEKERVDDDGHGGNKRSPERSEAEAGQLLESAGKKV